ncbi:uncharacterized protein NESG_00203 [Nematocida ausubeli]|uniref:Uncharacterized protein n=1 Tax=Nematocida ausubeli (strain ATCC PRA-371 / ERTm2) TaxID=1913371 RepID=A0A086J4R0_NEMA1|nr:uncharacterized protein NESG_00203 [Nematocida ausubeli]KFG27128.1 hypothetical protein NESG_00203 [Nematocida ausubeli]
MDFAKKEETIPATMRYLIVLASFLSLPVFVAEQRLLEKKYILCSFAGYTVGPFLALIPLGYKARCMLGSACSALPLFFSFAPYLHAFLLGLISSYYRLVIDLFCQALCVKTKKKQVVIMTNLIGAWISFFTFFSLRFYPVISFFICTRFCTVLFACAGTVLSYIFIIETPEEIFKRYRAAEKKSAAYEDLYKCIMYINSSQQINMEDFQKDYREYLNEKTQPNDNSTLRERATAILAAVNISFIYIAFQRAAGVQNKYSLYRIFLGCMQLFTWAINYMSGMGTIYSFLIPPASLYFVCVSTNNPEDIALVFVMLFGIGLVSHRASAHSLTPAEMALSRSLQYIFVTPIFLILVLNFLD